MLKFTYDKFNGNNEYKREYSDTLIKDVAGFLNYSSGGHIYIGIENNGAITGVDNADELQLKIINLIRDNIYPSALGLFDVLTENNDNVAFKKYSIILLKPRNIHNRPHVRSFINLYGFFDCGVPR